MAIFYSTNWNTVVFSASQQCCPQWVMEWCDESQALKSKLGTWTLGRDGKWKKSLWRSQLFYYRKIKRCYGWLRMSGFVLSFFTAICESLSASRWTFHVSGICCILYFPHYFCILLRMYMWPYSSFSRPHTILKEKIFWELKIMILSRLALLNWYRNLNNS